MTDREKTQWLLSLAIEHRVQRGTYPHNIVVLVKNIHDLTEKEIHTIALGYDFWKEKYLDKKTQAV